MNVASEEKRGSDEWAVDGVKGRPAATENGKGC